MMNKPVLKNVLYVEDDSDIRELVKIALNSLGNYHVDTCVNGKDALEKCKTLKPQLVLLDVIMPGISGPNVFQELQQIQHYQTVPVIFLTAKNQEEEIEEYLELGAAGVISKPFDPVELPRQINDIWNDYHQKSAEAYSDGLEKLRQKYLKNLNQSIKSIQHQLVAIDSQTLNSDDLKAFMIKIGNLQGSGESFGYQDVSNSARILMHSLEEIKLDGKSVILSDRDASRLSAIMLALIAIIEKTVTSATKKSRLMSLEAPAHK
ncbi:response regulator [Endozoicomonas arenosclerae]|uniref:response regulator n=1 Tax=Endozoicomonas arenosclerae TaxID=1633495 RepID=UPI000B021EDC|nr:response regulator [Endozoicomonas arenosclerae]